MEKKTVSATILTLLLASMLTPAFDIQPVKAERTLYIRADGSIDPPTAPIITVDNITYTLTGNVIGDGDGIVVEKDNIVVDGAGYAIRGATSRTGVDLSGRDNVTIRSLIISNFGYGIYLHYSSNNRISENNITNNGQYGIWISEYSNNTTIVGNDITDNSWAGVTLNSAYNSIRRNNITNNRWAGFILAYSSENSIVGNEITNNSQYGIMLESSSNHNIIAGNNITDNYYGIFLHESSNNSIHHDNFMNNIRQVYDDSWDYSSYKPSINMWDDGYPSGGNYWNDYTGVDANGDGIGDVPYVIDASNQDHYPLMNPWSSLPIHNINTGLGYATIQEAINADETLDGHAIFVEAGTYYENVVVNKTITLIGENRNTTVIDGREKRENTFSINADYVSISEFTITKADRFNSCVYVQSNHNDIFDNVITGGLSDGIILWHSNSSIVFGNFITEKHASIILDGSKDNIVDGNVIAGNMFGIMLWEGSFNNTVKNNKLESAGIELSHAYNNTIEGNLLKNNSYGVHLTGYVNTSENRIFRNTIESNSIGIWLERYDVDPNNNSFYHNNLIDNAMQALCESTEILNVWDNGYSYEGNYWSDYNGTDSNGDGIGDTPYTIDTSSADNYPLMNVYWNPCDINHDLTVNMKDIGRACRAYNTVPGDTLWNPHADITGSLDVPDGKVDMRDIGLMARHFLESYT